MQHASNIGFRAQRVYQDTLADINSVQDACDAREAVSRALNTVHWQGTGWASAGAVEVGAAVSS